MKVVGLSESAVLTDKTPPISSKQQESYSTEFKEKTSVLLWKVKKKKNQLNMRVMLGIINDARA